jgi:phosphatidylinositol alpha-mannosyltransferase
MKTLKIALVLDDTLDTPDGVAQYVLTVGKWLVQQGYSVHYLVGMSERHDVPQVHSLAHNIKVKFNGNVSSVPLPASRRRLRKLLETEQFDILHVQTPYSPFLAGRLIRLASKRTAIVGSFHVLPYNRAVVIANRLLALVNRRTAKRIDIMLANSTAASDFAHTVYGFDPVVVPNPFPLADFSIKSLPTDGPLNIVFLGRLVARKGASQLLAAIAYVRDCKLITTPYRVIIGGKGPLRAELEAFVAKHKLQDVVTFRGFVAEADKATFLAQADIGVFPSVSGESFGISLIEALEACRGVVLGGDNPGYRSVLRPLAADQLVKPDDAAAFAKRLATWTNDKTARDRAAAAQKAYVKQFDINVVGQKILNVYAEVLKDRDSSNDDFQLRERS